MFESAITYLKLCVKSKKEVINSGIIASEYTLKEQEQHVAEFENAIKVLEDAETAVQCREKIEECPLRYSNCLSLIGMDKCPDNVWCNKTGCQSERKE